MTDTSMKENLQLKIYDRIAITARQILMLEECMSVLLLKTMKEPNNKVVERQWRLMNSITRRMRKFTTQLLSETIEERLKALDDEIEREIFYCAYQLALSIVEENK